MEQDFGNLLLRSIREKLVDVPATEAMAPPVIAPLVPNPSVDAFTWFNHCFDLPLADYQREIIANIVDPSVTRLLILAPPGHRKSTVAAASVAWLLATTMLNRCVVASYASDYSETILAQMCDLLASPQSEESLGVIFPKGWENQSKRWSSDMRYFPGQSHISKDPTLRAIGFKAGTIGTRSSILLADDLVTQINSQTSTLRTNLSHWFWGSLVKRVEPNGKIIVVGARFYEDDLYGEIIGKRGWKVLSFAAWPQSPLWPERFDGDYLEMEYANDPVHYPAQYGQDPIKSVRGILKSEWLQYYLPEAIDLSDMPLFAGVDTCKAGGKNTDEIAIAIGAYDAANKVIYLVNFISGSYEIEDQADLIIRAAQDYNLALVNVEEDFAVTSRLRDKAPMMSLTKSRSFLSKDMRLQSLGAVALKGNILFPGQPDENGNLAPADYIEGFVNQWKNYPSVKHDDFLDAVEKLKEAVNVGVEPAGGVVTRTSGHSVKSRERRRGQRSGLVYHNIEII